jgi:hypothetical protein
LRRTTKRAKIRRLWVSEEELRMGAQTDYEQLLTAIDQLYAAALDPIKWNGFLSSLATQFEAQNAFVCEVEYRERNLAYVGLPQPGRARLPVQRYETLIDEDPRTYAFRSSGVQPVHCRMATTTERLHDSRVYREYLKPLGIEYTMVVVLPMRDGVTRDLGLTRGVDSRPFDENDRALMSRLVPHVERAFTINGALRSRRNSRRRGNWRMFGASTRGCCSRASSSRRRRRNSRRCSMTARA